MVYKSKCMHYKFDVQVDKTNKLNVLVLTYMPKYKKYNDDVEIPKYYIDSVVCFIDVDNNI